MEKLNSSTKPLLLVFPYNVMAHYLRCLQLASYLKPYFEIKFLSSPLYNSFVTIAGFETFECEALNAEKVQQCITSFDFSWLNEKDLSYIYTQQVKVIKELNASAVLGDMSPTLKMAAEKTGTFHFSLINGYMSKHYTYVRRIPKSFPLSKMFNVLPPSLITYFTNVGEQISFHSIHRPFSKIRKRNKLSPLYSYLQELEGNINLLCDLPDIFPQKNLPDNYYFIPPLYHVTNNNDDEIIEKLDCEKKTLYVSMGSTGDWQKVAFLNDPYFLKYNIVTAGDVNNILSGPNVFSFRFINNNKIFTKTDLVICHGGNGTTYQSLSFGIPVLCKTTHLEQEYNVDGLERSRLGKSLDNINTNEQYISTIEEWIGKKENADLLFIKKKIAEAKSNFEKTIDEIMKASYLNKDQPKENRWQKLSV